MYVYALYNVHIPDTYIIYNNIIYNVYCNTCVCNKIPSTRRTRTTTNMAVGVVEDEGKNMKITTIYRWWNVISFAPVFASWDSAASSSRQYWLSIRTNITDDIYIYVWCRVLNVLKITAAVVLHSVPLQCTTGAVHPLQIPVYIYIYIYSSYCVAFTYGSAAIL